MSNGFGIQPSGYVPKLQGDCFADIETAMQSNVAPVIDMSATQPLGALAAATSNELALLWAVAGVCYGGLNPANASGFVADAVASYTGTQRSQDTFGQVVATLTLEASAQVGTGALAAVTGQPTDMWELLGPCNADGTGYVPGPVSATNAGTYYAMFQCTAPGTIEALAGTLTVIVSTSSGWDAITNALDATAGAATEDDAALLAKRTEELASSGNGTVDALEAALYELSGVLGATVNENDTEATDGNGVPAHSMHVVLYLDPLNPPTSGQIAQVIWNRGKNTG